MKNDNLYDMLVYYSIIGLECLIDTYTSGSKQSLLYTLQMFKGLLEKPDNFSNNNFQTNIDTVFIEITNIYDDNIYYIIFHTIEKLIKNNDLDKVHKTINSLNKIIYNNVDDIKTWISKSVVF